MPHFETAWAGCVGWVSPPSRQHPTKFRSTGETAVRLSPADSHLTHGSPPLRDRVFPWCDACVQDLEFFGSRNALSFMDPAVYFTPYHSMRPPSPSAA